MSPTFNSRYYTGIEIDIPYDHDSLRTFGEAEKEILFRTLSAEYKLVTIMMQYENNFTTEYSAIWKVSPLVYKENRWNIDYSRDSNKEVTSKSLRNN
ncbi:hypothetical protein RhiirC2_787705 [Rhizophagus irregularis]|uniref:Uncharacterized protein n=1 Tax=Rhizophagus irregularis TaxID=588596 RepID=A0A2N1MRM3_9GLOM|nr:hypothetical protein RhiirC2_787705 [Rhizophagus irregularis]